jgi:hypothetical protein
MKTPTKFKFELNGMTFQLPIKHLRTKDYKGNPEEPKIIMAQAASASVVKQYVKKLYPNVVVASVSDSFSMGNSVDVYICDERGGEVDDKIIKDVRRFGDRFVYGRFNGMNDMYELSERRGMETDGGTPIDASVKYLHINNRPKFCSVPDIYRMIYDMTQTTNYVFGQISMEKAIEHVKGYGATAIQISKAKALINY